MESSNQKFSDLMELLKEGELLGLDLNEFREKLESVISTNQNGLIKIVLMGSFSDGKTSTIAGLIGKLQDSMKIDIAESSDEISIYRLEGLDNGYEVVDTPGLFGTKEREIDGKQIKYSDITKKYISEAHLLLYVCDAVVPLKDSHKESLKLVLREFNKLSSTIFVINKMDEAGVDMTDDEEYEESAAIKIENLKGRLRSTIQLTEQEEAALKIVCIAADPKQKSMDYWLQESNIESYKKRSHIELVRESMHSIINQSNKELLIAEADYAVVKDVMIQAIQKIKQIEESINTPLESGKKLLNEMKSDLTLLKGELLQSRQLAKEQLKQLHNSLLDDITAIASLSDLGQFFERKIGIKEENATFYILFDEIDSIITACTESNNTILESVSISFENRLNIHGQYVKTALGHASKLLKGLKIDNQMIFKIRDIAFKSYKFKPYGAINMASKATKVLGVVGTALSIFVELRDVWKKWKDAEKLESAKQELKAALSDIFENVTSGFKGDDFFKNYAPSYIQMQELITEREKFCNDLQMQNSGLEEYKAKLSDFLKIDIEDAEYEEID